MHCRLHMKHVALVSTVVLLLCFSTQAQTAAPNDAQFKDGSYYNLFFNLAYTYPKDWVVHDQEINDRIRERAKEEAARTGTLRQMNHTYPLLSVTRHPRGTPGLNPTIFVVAERIDFWPGKPDAKEYLLSLRESRTKRGFKATLNEPEIFRVGSLEFLRDDYSGEVNGVSMRASYFVTVKKGYAVIFSFNAADEASVNEMAQSMNTILPLGIIGTSAPRSAPERKP